MLKRVQLPNDVHVHAVRRSASFLHGEMPGGTGLDTGLTGGGAAPACGRGGTVAVPPGGRKRGRRQAAGQGGSMPPRLGAMHPHPAGRCCRRDGDSPSWDCHVQRRAWPNRRGLGRPPWRLREKAVVGRARRGHRLASAQGGYLSPARRRAAPAGRGTEPMGFRPTPQAAGRRERSDRRGRRIGAQFAAGASRATLSQTYKTYKYLLSTVFGTSIRPFLGLAAAKIGPGERPFWAWPEFGTSSKIGPCCG